jgi:hypothetical protein
VPAHRSRRAFLIAALALPACATPVVRQPSDTTATPATTPPSSPTSTATPASGPTSAATRVTLAATPEARPLVPHQVTVEAPGHSGPAELHLFDGRDRRVGRYALQLGERAAMSVTPRGALGPQRAELIAGGEVLARAEPLFTLAAETALVTGQPRFDELYPRIRGFMDQCVLEYELDGVLVRGYRSPDNPLLWLRDHTYQARGFRYFEPDVTSLIDAFRRAQLPDGSFPDFLARPPVADQAGRKEVEADVEFLFVQAAYEAWQATGDDEWLGETLPAMRRALAYTMTNSLRWDAERGLVKRPYTIDMWDFEYGPTTTNPANGRPSPRHWIDERTLWGVFHGDNTGLAHALELLARAEERAGEPERAAEYRAHARGIVERLNELSWNGSFYTHHVPLEPFEPPGVDAARQLSLSNTYALNRGVLRASQAHDIVNEYYRRGLERGTTFAEWYSIDPPFPAGSYGLAGRPGEEPGEYVNGGIMPLVGGELARGAFRYGAESYGFAILHRYHFLVSSTGASYLWYYPAGNPGISGADTLATDGWGSSAMLGALIEGAAGIEDRGVLYQDVRISPRWSHTPDVRSAWVVARYAASDAYAAYRWEWRANTITLDVTGSGERAKVRLLLPAEAGDNITARVNGRPAPFEFERVQGSRYVVLNVEGGGVVEVRF